MALSGFPQAFDLFLGAAAAALVFPTVLFPMLPHALALWAGLAVWSLAYVASPLGAWLFKGLRARHGAGVQLTAARVLLGGSMAAVAFLPGFSAAGGMAVLFLAVVRIAHGLALGGAADEGPAVRAFARAPHGRLWTAITLSQAVLLGLVAAVAIDSALLATLSRADFLDWGWRYPFILGVAANIVALFAHLRLFTTDPAERTDGRAWVRIAAEERRAPDRRP
jgi:MFS family permease